MRYYHSVWLDISWILLGIESSIMFIELKVRKSSIQVWLLSKSKFLKTVIISLHAVYWVDPQHLKITKSLHSKLKMWYSEQVGNRAYLPFWKIWIWVQLNPTSSPQMKYWNIEGSSPCWGTSKLIMWRSWLLLVGLIVGSHVLGCSFMDLRCTRKELWNQKPVGMRKGRCLNLNQRISPTQISQRTTPRIQIIRIGNR